MKFKIVKFLNLMILRKKRTIEESLKNVSSFKVLFFGLTKQQKHIEHNLNLQKILAHLN